MNGRDRFRVSCTARTRAGARPDGMEPTLPFRVSLFQRWAATRCRWLARVERFAGFSLWNRSQRTRPRSADRGSSGTSSRRPLRKSGRGRAARTSPGWMSLTGSGANPLRGSRPCLTRRQRPSRSLSGQRHSGSLRSRCCWSWGCGRRGADGRGYSRLSGTGSRGCTGLSRPCRCRSSDWRARHPWSRGTDRWWRRSRSCDGGFRLDSSSAWRCRRRRDGASRSARRRRCTG